MIQRLKPLLFSLLGLDPEAVVVVVRSGDPARAEKMASIMRELVPGRRIVDIPLESGDTIDLALRLLRRLRGLRVALMATLCDGTPGGAALRRAAFLAAPGKVLAFNSALERQHIRPGEWIASWLFLRGVPRDRIFLRPRWLVPRQRERSVLPRQWLPRGGSGFRQGLPRIAIVSPYFPWPRSHGGAVRLEGLLRHASRQADILFFGFEDSQTEADFASTAAICARVYSAPKPRYLEPRWSTILPPEACEFWNPDLDAALRREMSAAGCTLLQAEYTQMARYRPDILVEHDITADLMAQVHRLRPGLSTWWDLWRWRRFERAALRRARRVVVMSEKDRALSGLPGAAIIPNGVDLERFSPAPDPANRRLLFVGSFRHFPNVRAWRFFLEQVWPLLDGIDGIEATVIAGPEPELYYQPARSDPRITQHAYVADVRPHYQQAALVVIPTLESAGTNLKALEAAAMGRAIVSTPSGVAGLGFTHAENVWLADSPEAFAEAVRRLLLEPAFRCGLAAAARAHVERFYGWPALAQLQVDLWKELSR
jgi:glycosyltransferase involved in cell wall biosynthesis